MFSLSDGGRRHHTRDKGTFVISGWDSELKYAFMRKDHPLFRYTG